MSPPIARRPFVVTIVENTVPGGCLCKVYEYDTVKRGVLDRTGAFLSEGRARIASFESLSQFMTFRGQLQTHQALIMGRPHYEDARIVTQEHLARLTTE